MRFTKDEIGGGFAPELLQYVLEPVFGAQGVGYDFIATDSRSLRIHGADRGLRDEALDALQAHSAIGPLGWAAVIAALESNLDSYTPVVGSLSLVMLIYHNRLRRWMREFEVSLEAATSLEDLQARAIPLPAVPHITRDRLQNDVETILAPVVTA